jgi:two-component system response regulator NreC
MAIGILIADDHQLVLDGLAALVKDLPDFDLLSTARNGEEAVKLTTLLRPDVVLMDIDMPIMNGLEALRRIKTDRPETKVIMLTMHGEPALVKKGIALGAQGYLLKNADKEDFEEALNKVAQNKSFFSPELTKTLAEGKAKPTYGKQHQDTLLLAQLTTREIEILKLITEGLSNKEIGDALFISHRTVDTHRTNLMKKLEVHHIAGLVKFAINNGLNTEA